MQEYPEPPTLEVGQFKAVAKSHHIGNKPDTGRYTFAWKYRRAPKLRRDWGRSRKCSVTPPSQRLEISTGRWNESRSTLRVR